MLPIDAWCSAGSVWWCCSPGWGRFVSSLKKGHMQNRSLDDGEVKKSEKDSCDGTVRRQGGNEDRGASWDVWREIQGSSDRKPERHWVRRGLERGSDPWHVTQLCPQSIGLAACILKEKPEEAVCVHLRPWFLSYRMFLRDVCTAIKVHITRWDFNFLTVSGPSLFSGDTLSWMLLVITHATLVLPVNTLILFTAVSLDCFLCFTFTFKFLIPQKSYLIITVVSHVTYTLVQRPAAMPRNKGRDVLF